MLPLVIRATQDPVPNIRFNVAKTLKELSKRVDQEDVESHIKPALNNLAKATTFLQMITISALLPVASGNQIINMNDYNAKTIGMILLWISAFLTLFTGYEYLRKGIDYAISEDNKS